MSQIHWLNPVSGGFTNAADWQGGTVPGASDDAILDAVGATFTVTSAVSETVDSLQLAANATLSITGGTFDAVAGTGAGANAGVILVGANDTLSLGGVVANSGAITLDSSTTMGHYAALTLAANTTLTGGGVVNDAGQINAAAGGRIVNQNETIIADAETSNGIDSLFNASAAGTTFVNGRKGLVEIDGLLFVGGQQVLSIVNNGSIVCNIGYLDISNTNISGSGLISVGHYGHVQFTGAGTVKGQQISLGDEAYAYIGNGAVDYSGTLQNAGSIRLAGTLTLTGDTTLAGGGTITLGNGGGGSLGGTAGRTLVNVDNVINGFGDVGEGEIGIVNEAGGIISGGFVLDSGRRTISNAGLISASFEAMTLSGSIDNTGTIVSLDGQLTIGGTLLNDGLLSVSGGKGESGVLTLDNYVSGSGSTVIGNNGTLNADGLFSEYHDAAFEQSVTFTGSGFLRLAASRDYEGAISGFSTTGATSLDLGDIRFVSSSEATFSGTASGGVLTVTDGKHGARITLVGNYLSSTFVSVNDGHGGVIVVAIPTPTAPGSHALVAAMASLGASSAATVRQCGAWAERDPLLTSPHAAFG
jgi:hypothetical protein